MNHGGPTTRCHDGMRIDFDVAIPMDDGVLLRCDVFRPDEDGEFPVIMSAGPYAKGLVAADAWPPQWSTLTDGHPEVLAGSSQRYQNWEVADPERFVPDGYAVVRVDVRGSGRSPGFLDPWSAREARDYHDCIEWAAAQPWCSGKVGLSGVSYLAMNQWQVAALQPPHLAALVICEGASDLYREFVRHGGILNSFNELWYDPAVVAVQHGRGARGVRSGMTGDLVAGPDTLSEEQLAANRCDWPAACSDHALASDEFWASRAVDFSKITAPLLSMANWGGQGLHLRGNVEGFLAAASEQKWLELHGLQHWVEYYTDYGVELQKRFLGHFLKGEDTGWERRPRVQLNVRRPGDRFELRAEHEFPLSRTRWTPLYLETGGMGLQDVPQEQEAIATYRGFSDGLTFLGPILEEDTEITGPAAVKLFVSSDTEDADLFVVLRAFSPDLRELTFTGHSDPHTPIGQGWLRASRRKLDLERSLPHRPYHAHDEVQPLLPGEVYELDIEVWPTCVVVPKGYRLGLSVRGNDHRWQGDPPGGNAFPHVDPHDRPAAVFDNAVTLHSGPEHRCAVLLPLIPSGS